LGEALGAGWPALLGDELASPWFLELTAAVEAERRTHTVFPPAGEVFTAFRLTPLDDVKVVILGQDPYHGAGQAHGLAFSVKPGVKPPPSLKNMFKELVVDAGCPMPQTGCLEGWARQGVLLLNTVLTVREGEAHSHKGLGWERFTDAVIEKLSRREGHRVFVLWGGPARKKAKLVDTSRHSLVEGAHPSPLSARHWFGCKAFSAINQALVAHGQQGVDWSSL
jgi:uracil-DNA glycosylase